MRSEVSVSVQVGKLGHVFHFRLSVRSVLLERQAAKCERVHSSLDLEMETHNAGVG